ncbi:MAG: hypothetical protein AAGA15_03640 [Pseudomonadota bacterium]
MSKAIHLIADQAILAEALKRAAATPEVEAVSETSMLDPQQTLNAGINPEDIKLALEIATLIFKYGAAVLAFAVTLRDYLKEEESEEAVAMADPKSGETLIEITAETKDVEIAAALGADPSGAEDGEAEDGAAEGGAAEDGGDG